MEVFKIEIRVGNEAVQDSRDIATLLRSVARRLDNVTETGTVSGLIHDANGNTVGSWSLEGDS